MNIYYLYYVMHYTVIDKSFSLIQLFNLFLIFVSAYKENCLILCKSLFKMLTILILNYHLNVNNIKTTATKFYRIFTTTNNKTWTCNLT